FFGLADEEAPIRWRVEARLLRVAIRRPAPERVAEVDGRERDHHDAAIRGDPLEHRVGDIAGMIIERARTRMRKDYWRFRHTQRIEHRRFTHVTEIDQHAEAVELEHDRLAERGEP